MINQEQLIADIKTYGEKVTLPTEKTTALFRNALTDTITKTVSVRVNGEIFVATGDIPAMWLRDSTFQVLPYLEMVDEIPEISQLIHGVLQQQLTYLNHDPYSNAFNKEEDGGHYSNDTSDIPISPLVWERKFEIDSLCAPLFLAYHLNKKATYTAHLDSYFWDSVNLAVDTLIHEQNHQDSSYTFERTECPPSDTLPRDGKGSEIGYTGMVWSAFRPSDDACTYGYFIPGNMYIVVVLDQMLELLEKQAEYAELKTKMLTLKKDILQGISEFGTLTDSEGRPYYAYEVDGLGNSLFMDDANVPSLLSLPFLGFCEEKDKTYQNTRQKILSDQNPYYYEGQVLKGIGSPHTPPNHVWPISLAMEGLTSTDANFVKDQLILISETDGGTLQCHEGVHVDNSSIYTREWFSWSNMTYCQLAFHYLGLVD